jgi:DNA-binding response OmpR family regulator
MDQIDVLAIDDDKLIHKIIRKALQGAGFAVRSAQDGATGLAEALKAPPQVVLLDVEMPGMNGYQVCEKLVEREEFKHIPIVFLSSHSSLQERMLGYETGADDYIVKPFQSEELAARLRVLLRYAEEQKELHNQVIIANQTAMQALTTTSELGQALSYMERSLTFNTIGEAALGLLEVTSSLALDCRLMITLESSNHWYPGEDQVSPLEKELIEMSDRNQRFLDFGASTLVSYPAVSLLVTNMPLDDAERYGRIKDLLPLLLSGLSSKIYALATQEALRTHSRELTHSLARIRGSLFALGTNMLQNRKDSNATLQSMINDLQDDLLRMGLEEDEEQYLIDRIDQSAEHALEKMDAGTQIGHSFEFVHANLKQVAEQQHRLSQAFEYILEQQKQAHNAASGDIELF